MGKVSRPTLCWDCENSTGGCSWSDHWKHVPVKGWVAIRTKINWNNGDNDCSYIVLECPEFERDSYGGGQYWHRKIDKNKDEI